jgi:hypothetical protein
MSDNHMNVNPFDLEMVVSKNFSAKFGTKGEVWRFMASEARVYVPSYQTITIWHLKDLASGVKK